MEPLFIPTREMFVNNEKILNKIEKEINSNLTDTLESKYPDTCFSLFLKTSADWLTSYTKHFITQLLTTKHRFKENEIESIKPSSDEYPCIMITIKLDLTND